MELTKERAKLTYLSPEIEQIALLGGECIMQNSITDANDDDDFNGDNY